MILKQILDFHQTQKKFKGKNMLTLLSSLVLAEPLTEPETSYYGASILEGDIDITFSDVYNLNNEYDENTYSFFEGNTLYLGNSDDYGNSIDGIVEFFWFQSSIDRGTDFYVAVVKVRATPGNDCPWWWGGTQCELWADDWQDWGEYPVVSVEAITDVIREQGAFRWDWAVPFENYGIDAYGQVTFGNQYGIGASAEGSSMTGVSLPEGTNINGVPVEGDANVQVKGYVSPEYKVQTQYNVTLYEWDVYVNGRADLMAWDVYLNLGERANQSAYHEFFLPIQVELGNPFMLDQLNFLATFDTGNINPFSHQLGLSLQGIVINPPLWVPVEEEIVDPVEEPSEEPIEEQEEEVIDEDTAVEVDTGEIDKNKDSNKDMSIVEAEPVKGCNAPINASGKNYFFLTLFAILGLMRRKE